MALLKVANIHFNLAGTTVLRANGADTVTLETAGFERLRVDPSGRVGINTSSPTSSLQVVGNTSISTDIRVGGFISLDVNDAVRISDPTPNTLVLTTQSIERFRVGELGQFGIGGATYGANGAILMSSGSLTPPTWTKPGTRTLPATTTTSPFSWNSDNYDQYSFSALDASITINADLGTPVDGQKMTFRVQDNGTIRTLTFTGGSSKSFKPIGVTMTASGSNWTYTTTANKKTYFGCVYSAVDARWDIVAISQEA